MLFGLQLKNMNSDKEELIRKMKGKIISKNNRNDIRTKCKKRKNMAKKQRKALKLQQRENSKRAADKT